MSFPVMCSGYVSRGGIAGSGSFKRFWIHISICPLGKLSNVYSVISVQEHLFLCTVTIQPFYIGESGRQEIISGFHLCFSYS